MEVEMLPTKGRLMVVDVHPHETKLFVEGCAGNAFGAPFVSHGIDSECNLQPGDRLLAIDGSSVLTSSSHDLKKRATKIRRFGARVVLQRQGAKAFQLIIDEVKSVQENSQPAPSVNVIRPIHLTVGRKQSKSVVKGRLFELNTTTAQVHTLFANATTFEPLGTLQVADSFLKDASELPIQPSDCLLAIGSFSLLSQVEPLARVQDLLLHAPPTSQMNTVVLRQLPDEVQAAGISHSHKAVPKLKVKRQVKAEGLDGGEELSEWNQGLEMLDKIQQQLQSMAPATYVPGETIPRLNEDPDISDLTSPFFFDMGDIVDTAAVEAERSAHTVAKPKVAQRITLTRVVAGPAVMPVDLGFALVELSDDIAGRVISRLVIHSVWNRAWKSAGLAPGLALVNVNGHDVKDFSAHACMHFVSSLKVPARLKVMPIGNGHHKAWHASSPRCVAFRVEPELAAKSWGLSMTASTIERGDAHVAAVDPLVPQVAAGVHSGDKVLAINMLDTSGVSYTGLMKTIESQAEEPFVSLVLQSTDQQALSRPRTLTIGRQHGSSFGMVVVGSDIKASTPYQMPGAFVSYVHPSLIGRLHVGDRILQVNGVTTTRATCKTVRTLIEDSPGLEVELGVKHDPAGFISLLEEMETGGNDAQTVLLQALGQAPYQAAPLPTLYSAIKDERVTNVFQWPMHRVMMAGTPRKK